MIRRLKISRAVSRLAALFAIFVSAGSGALSRAYAEGVSLPKPVVDAPLAAKKRKETAVVAGGCFGGVQAVFSTSKALKMLSRAIRVEPCQAKITAATPMSAAPARLTSIACINSSRDRRGQDFRD